MDAARIREIDAWCESVRDDAQQYGRFRYAQQAVHPHSLHVTDGQIQSDTLGTRMFAHFQMLAEEILA